ncbi:MAG: hypothetical protein AMXMBFR84_09930 [Candidatus Hydrogenedentota bacterium]
MLSRVANSIYWLCRYIERAENVARILHVNWHLSLGDQRTAQEQWQPLVNITADTALFEAKYGNATKENVIQFMVSDSEYPNSIISCLEAARENARSIREIIPEEMWEQVNTFYYMVRDAAVSSRPNADLNEFLTGIRKRSNEFVGLALTTMTHDEGWHFCRLGRMLERADQTSRILDVKFFYLLPNPKDVGGPMDSIQWLALLQSASALQAYRRQQGSMSYEKVVGFLLLDSQFPRAVRYCTDRVLDSVHCVTGTPKGAFTNTVERECGKLCADLAYAQANEIIAQGLHDYIDNLQKRFIRCGEAIHEAFFATRLVGNGTVSLPQ